MLRRLQWPQPAGARMNQTEIFVKTEAGADEVRARSRKLAPRLRTMLIMIDGSLSVSQLAEAAATLGAPSDFLQALQEQGLIRRRAAAAAAESSVASDAGRATAPADLDLPLPALNEGDRFRAAQKFMNDTAVDAMGLRAFFFTLKMEKCFTSADLRDLLPDYLKLVTKGSGEETARVLGARARDLLG
jgi:hypothetical protein